MKWTKLRISLLAVTFSSAVYVLGWSIVTDFTTRKHEASAFVFPLTVPLSPWQQLESRPLASRAKGVRYFSGQQYKYKQNDIPLEIEMRYVANSNGDVAIYTENFASFPPSLALANIHHQENLGFYSLFAYQNKAYLLSCINPRGEATMTHQQLKLNQRAYDLQLGRVLPWLLGTEPIRDNRCIWASLSVPIQDTSSTSAYQLLETVWISWYPLWTKNFPKY